MTAALPEGLPQDLGRPDLRVTFRAAATTCGVAERAIKSQSARMPEHHSGRFFLKMEQIQDVAQITVIRR